MLKVALRAILRLLYNRLSEKEVPLKDLWIDEARKQVVRDRVEADERGVNALSAEYPSIEYYLPKRWTKGMPSDSETLSFIGDPPLPDFNEVEPPKDFVEEWGPFIDRQEGWEKGDRNA